jgi:hypothetical protein
MMKHRLAAASAVAFFAFAPLIAQACATCGCSLSSDAATGYSAGPGWRVDLQYSYIDQSQLRSGTSAVSEPQVAAINNNGGAQEVEKDTINRYLTLGVAYSPNADWNFNIQVPYVSRSHSTYSNATTDQLTPSNLSSTSFGDLGDVRLIATYQGILPTNNFGVQFGVKVPTGDYGGQNVVTGEQVGRHPVYFSSGPNAVAGQTIDTIFQPGTGSTDIIVGAYYYQAVSQDFDAFINARFEVAALESLDQVNANYRPGNLTTISAGLRYEHSPIWVPQLQVNYTHKSQDQGVLADITDTAGDVVYLSPGLTVQLDTALHVYGFMQVPIYSDLIGYQLFPRWTANAGISYAF